MSKFVNSLGNIRAHGRRQSTDAGASAPTPGRTRTCGASARMARQFFASPSWSAARRRSGPRPAGRVRRGVTRCCCCCCAGETTAARTSTTTSFEFCSADAGAGGQRALAPHLAAGLHVAEHHAGAGVAHGIGDRLLQGMVVDALGQLGRAGGEYACDQQNRRQGFQGLRLLF